MIVDEANPPAALRFCDALPDALTSLTLLLAWFFPQIFSPDFLGNLSSVAALEIAFCILLSVIYIKLDLTQTVDFLMVIVIFSLCAIAVAVSVVPTASGMLILIPYVFVVVAKLNYSVFRESTRITTRKRNFFSGFCCVVSITVLILVLVLPVPYFGMNEELAMSLPSPGGLLDWGYDNIHIAYAFGTIYFMVIAIMRYRWNLQLQRDIWT